MAVINGSGFGTTENDTFYGTNGNDVFFAAAFSFTFAVEDGDDLAFGYAGNDYLGTFSFFGNTGNDTLDGGTGTDTLVGGVGNDVYYIDTVNDSVVEGANEGIDTIYSSVFDDINTTMPDNVENLYLSGTRDKNGIGNALDNTIIGNTGNNVLNGDSGNDYLSGEGGNDVLGGFTGNDALRGADGNDTLAGQNDNDNLTGGNGDDWLLGGQGNDSIVDTNSIYLGNDYIQGGSGNDTLGGSYGNDTVTGNEDNDLLIGYSRGIDTLTGGTGADTFVFNISSYSNAEGVDKITDFNFREGDKIQIIVDDGTTPFSYFSYDQGSGNLSYDNPSDNISPTLVVTLQANLGDGFIPSEDIILEQVIF